MTRPVTVTLGLTEEVRRRMADGTCYRDGGVVRERASGRIVTILRDVELEEEPAGPGDELACQLPRLAVGLDLRGVERRLARVEAALQQVLGRMDDLEARAELAGLHQVAARLGPLRGRVVACALDLGAGRRRALPGYRRAFLQDQHTFAHLVEGLCLDRRLFRRFPHLLHLYGQAMLLSGLCAARLTQGLDGEEAAADLEGEVAAHAEALCLAARATLDAPSSLFWQDAPHLRVLGAARRSRDLLRTRRQARGLLARAAGAPARSGP